MKLQLNSSNNMQKKSHANIKKFGLWFHKNVFVKYLQFRYHTTLMTLARLTLLVLAKEVVAPTIYWFCVLFNAIWPNTKLSSVLNAIKVACVPSTTELLIAMLSVVVLLIVAVAQYKTDHKRINILKSIYIPYTDAMFTYLNIEYYYEWTYKMAVSGNTMVHERQLDDLLEMSTFLKTRVRHREHELLDRLFESLAKVSEDIYRIYNYYGDFSRKDKFVTIEKFYKRQNIGINPNYNEDLKKYNDIVTLASDLVFEQTRLLNFILKVIREAEPDYLVLIGILHTDDVIEHGIYDAEEDDFEYKGIEDFMTRRSRNFHYGSGFVKLFE